MAEKAAIGKLDHIGIAVKNIQEARKFFEGVLGASFLYEHENPEAGYRLVELNVVENVYNLCKTSIVQNAWKNGQELSVHGWVYSISTGKITDMKVSTSNNDKLDDVFKFK